MAYADDVPLICDVPPGGILVLTTDLVLTREQRNRLRQELERARHAGIIVLDAGLKLQYFASREWPDAEFCAA